MKLLPPAATPSPNLTLLLTGNSNLLYIASNFIPFPLCNPKNNEKYVSGFICSPILSCTKALLNALYCSDEDKPLVCVNNFYFDPLTQKCDSKCSGNATRAPGSVSNKAICNFNCNNSSYCPINSVTEIADISTNYKCMSGFSKIGYKCSSANPINSN